MGKRKSILISCLLLALIAIVINIVNANKLRPPVKGVNTEITVNKTLKQNTHPTPTIKVQKAATLPTPNVISTPPQSLKSPELASSSQSNNDNHQKSATAESGNQQPTPTNSPLATTSISPTIAPSPTQAQEITDNNTVSITPATKPSHGIIVSGNGNGTNQSTGADVRITTGLAN